MERIEDKIFDFKKYTGNSIVLDCPECEDRDCTLNVCGLCHDIDAIVLEVAGGMYTCSGAVVAFKRTDYI